MSPEDDARVKALEVKVDALKEAFDSVLALLTGQESGTADHASLESVNAAREASCEVDAVANSFRRFQLDADRQMGRG
jgi:hypothetical protein